MSNDKSPTNMTGHRWVTKALIRAALHALGGAQQKCSRNPGTKMRAMHEIIARPEKLSGK
jgi:hypothetical protein